MEDISVEPPNVSDISQLNDSFYDEEIDAKLCESSDTLPASPDRDSLYDLEIDKFFSEPTDTQMDRPVSFYYLISNYNYFCILFF